MIAAGALIVMETLTSPRAIPRNSVCMASTGPARPPAPPHGGGGHARRRRVDRHGDADLAEVDPAEQRLHVVDGVHRDALAPDLAERPGGARAGAHARRQREGGAARPRPA